MKHLGKVVLWLESVLGRLANWLGVPGLVAECDYRATTADVRVRVRNGRLFTVININGTDIYFHRLTGEIDGIGFTPNADYTQGPIPRSAHPRPRIV